MAKCCNCGSGSLRRSDIDASFRICTECGGTTIVKTAETVAAAGRMKSLLASGWPHTPRKEGALF